MFRRTVSSMSLIRKTLAVAAATTLFAGSASALQFEFDYGDGVTGTLNTAVTFGAAWRLQDRATHLIGKANVRGLEVGENGAQADRGVCPAANGANGTHPGNCQGLFRAQPAQIIGRDAPGASSPNFDNGNLNFDQGDVVQQVGKVLQDLTLNYGDFGLFARWMYFHDYAQLNVLQKHPNTIGLNSTPIGTNSADGRPTWGPGDFIRDRITDSEVIKQAGTDFKLYDLNLFGFVDMSSIPFVSAIPWLGDREIAFKIGRQTVSWGESTLLVLNSLNQVNPIDANAFFRTGFAVEEVFSPVGMAFISTDITDNLGIEAYYQWEWEPLIAPAPGSFFSFTDAGTNNSGEPIMVSFGTNAEDPFRIGTPLDSGLNGVTNTTLTLVRGIDQEPRDTGQYGVSLKYFAEDFNNGTELGFYFMNYHSKLPYVNWVSTDLSCARAGGTTARDPIQFLANCPNLPLAGGAAATDNAVPLDTAGIFLTYPEDIHLYGVSFNTTVGDWSIQGEVAYRPNLPVQVDNEDLTFEAFAPTLSDCHDRLVGGAPDPAAASTPLPGNLCQGTNGLNANAVYGVSDSDPAAIINQGDTFNLAIGSAPGSARAFPAFVSPYRNLGDLRVRGELPANTLIRGFEEMSTLQYNFAGTYILGAADNPIGADQVIIVGEIGATQVLNMPRLDFLQFEAPGTYNHASAGADGTGADGTRQSGAAISVDTHASQSITNPNDGITTFVPAGADGLRFNVTQQDLRGYPDKLAWGYRLITIIKYENVLPGWGVEPFLVFGHDVNGTGIGPGENFVEDRKIFAGNVQFRYKAAFSLNLGYQIFTGGDPFNVIADRDVVNVFAKMLF